MGKAAPKNPRGHTAFRSSPTIPSGLLRAVDALPAHLVGLSMGGMIAFQIAVSHPELLRSMVIVNSGPDLTLPTLSAKI